MSALVDGELPLDEAMRELSQCNRSDDRLTWALYHQIGDVLRSESLAIPFSEGFDERLRARLAAEPPLTVAQTPDSAHGTRSTARHGRGAVGWGGVVLPGIGRPALLALALAGVMMIVFFSAYQRSRAPAMHAGESVVTPVVTIHADKLAPSDAGMADYVAAHKRISPSLYSAEENRSSAVFMAVTN